MKYRFSILLIFCLTMPLLKAQEIVKDGWQIFYDNYEWVPGSILVNMQMYNETPKPELPFVLIAGVGFDNCTPDGFPNNDEYQHLYNLSDSILSIISQTSAAVLTGTFTCQCKRTDYIYVNDTLGLRMKLYTMLNRSFKGYSPQLWIRPDKDWAAYRTFLYPNEEKLERLENEAQVTLLAARGIDPVTPRVIHHTLYFKSKSDRQSFIDYATANQFIIEDLKKIRKSDLRYELIISKSDFIEPEHFTHQTLELKHKAIELNGKYSGWNCD